MANVTHIYGNEVTDAAARGSLAPAYSASSTYAVGDLVLHEGQLYECSTAISTAEAWTAAHWTAKTVADEVTDLKGGLNDKLDAPETAGTSGQVLTSDGEGGQYWHTPSGGGGTSDYTDLSNKPQINSVTLSGNKSLSDLGIASASDLSDLEDVVDLTKIEILDEIGTNHKITSPTDFPVSVSKLESYTFGDVMYADGLNLFDFSDLSPVSPKGVTVTPLKNNAFLLNGTATGVTIGTFNKIYSDSDMLVSKGEKVVVKVWTTASIRLLMGLKLDGGTGYELKDTTISTTNQMVTVSITRSTSDNIVGAYLTFASTSGTSFNNDVVWVGVYHEGMTFHTVSTASELPTSFTASNTLSKFNTLYYLSQASYIANTKDYVDAFDVDINDKLTYVTPERFYGGYIPSDVDASSYISQAITYGIENDLPVFCGGSYTIQSMIDIHATGVNLFINEIDFTGTTGYAIRVTGRRNHIEINYLRSYAGAGGVNFYGINSNSGNYPAANYLQIMYVLCSGHCVAFTKADGVTLVGGFGSYNEIHLIHSYSANGSVVYFGANTGATENNIYGGEVTTLHSYVIWDECGGNFYYNFALESNAYSGIYVNCNSNKYINFRTSECENACDNSVDRIFMKMDGYSCKHQFVIRSPHGYSIDLTDHSTPSESYAPSQADGYQYGNMVCYPLIAANDEIPVGRTTYYKSNERYQNKVGTWAINWNGKVIHKLWKPSVVDVSANIDMNEQTESNIFNVSATATITLSPSYCADGIDEIIIIQSSSAVATLVDANGTTIFTGSQGNGTYQIKFVQEQTAFHPTSSLTWYTLVYGENNTAVINKLA